MYCPRQGVLRNCSVAGVIENEAAAMGFGDPK
jgi:hypothetical protein